jgi:hypothetical protein
MEHRLCTLAWVVRCLGVVVGDALRSVAERHDSSGGGMDCRVASRNGGGGETALRHGLRWWWAEIHHAGNCS